MSKFNEEIRRAALEALSEIRFMGSKVVLWSWDNSSSRLLKTLLNEGIVTQEEVLKEVDEAIRRMARHCYVAHRNVKGKALSMSISPEAVAYAIACDEFGWLEKRRMRFEDRSDLNDFMKKHFRKDLLERIFRQLVTETLPGEIKISHDPDECLSCP